MLRHFLIFASTFFVLPSFLDAIGNITLGNLIGIAGIAISLVVAAIVYFTRGEKSTKKSFKLSDLRKNNRKFRIQS
ncbi:MAG: hypothetical protein ACTSVZ_08555 [Promethearchaeota archaeon]